MASKKIETTLVIRGDTRQAVRQIKLTRKELDQLTASNDSSVRSMAKSKSSLVGLTGQMAKYAVAAGAVAAFASAKLGGEFIRVNTESERLKASLQTMTGSQQKAAEAFKDLEKFASRTPFVLGQSVEAFIKLKALGLDPSERALMSYGNTAAAMGKDMNQMIEAVADASTGEFERLKEFGIKASSQGEKVSFTFQGITTTIGKNSQEIQDYLLAIGETKFGDAMSNQMERLPGLFSNLEDSVDALFRKMGDDGGISGLSTALRGLTDSVQWTTDNITPLTRALEGVALVIIARQIPAIQAFVAAKSTAINTTMRATAVELSAAQTAQYAATYELEKVTAVRASIVADIAAEQVRLKAQISQQGLNASLARTIKLNRALTGATVLKTAAETADTVALGRLAVAQNAYNASVSVGTAAVGLFSGALALIGGPVGLAILAGFAIYSFAASADKAAENIRKLIKDLDDLGEMYKTLAETPEGIVGLEKLAVSFQDEVINLSTARDALIEARDKLAGKVRITQADIAQDQKLKSEIAALNPEIDKYIKKLDKVSAVLFAYGLNAGEAANGTKDLGTTQQKLMDKLKPVEARTREYAESLVVLTSILGTENMETEKAQELMLELQGLYPKVFTDLAKRNKLEKEQAELKIKNKASDKKYLEAIEAEYNMIGLSNRERAIQNALRKLSIEALPEEIALVKEKAAALYDSKEEAKPFADAWKAATERIDTAFADAWKGAFDSFSNFADSIKNAFKQLLAEMAHLAITKPILVSLGLGGSASAAAGTLGGTGGFNIFDLPSAFSAAKAALSPSGVLVAASDTLWKGVTFLEHTLADMGFDAAANGLYNSATAMSELPGGLAGGALISLAAGFAGSYLGTKFGEGLFGKQANSNIGATIGATIGTFILPGIGSAIGGFIGGIADSLFGSANNPPAGIFKTGDNITFRRPTDRTVRRDDVAGLTQSAFGQVGFGSTRDMFSGDNAQEHANQIFQLLDSFAVLEDILASTLDEDMVVSIKSTLDQVGEQVTEGKLGLDQFFADRFEIIFNEIGGGMERAFDRFTFDMSDQEFIENSAQIVTAVAAIGIATGDLKTVLDDFEAESSDLFESIVSLNSDYANTSIITIRNVDNALSDLSLEGENIGNTWVRIAQQLLITNAALDAVGESLFTLDTAGARVADTLINAFGGLEQFTSGMSAYHKLFIESRAPLEILGDTLNATFERLGVTLPKSKAGFVELVSGIDLTTESGAALYASLISLAPAVNALIVTTDKLALEELSIAANLIIDNARIESDLVRDNYRLRVSLLRKEISVGKQLMSDANKLRFSDISPLSAQERLDKAFENYTALALAAGNKDLEAASKLGAAGNTYLKELASFNGSDENYVSEFSRVTRELDSLGHAFGAGINVNQAIQVLNSQMLVELRAVNVAASTEIAKLAAIANSTDQINSELGGIDGLLATLPTDIAEALSGILAGAIASVVPVPIAPIVVPDISTGDGAGGGTPDTSLDPSSSVISQLTDDLVSDLYNFGLGRTPDQEGYEYWTTQFAGGQEKLINSFFAAIGPGDLSQRHVFEFEQDKFLSSLYTDTQGQAPEQADFDYYAEILDLGASISEVRALFISNAGAANTSDNSAVVDAIDRNTTAVIDLRKDLNDTSATSDKLRQNQINATERAPRPASSAQSVIPA